MPAGILSTTIPVVVEFLCTETRTSRPRSLVGQEEVSVLVTTR